MEAAHPSSGPRVGPLGFALVGLCAALSAPARAQEPESAAFEQSGKLRFVFQHKYGMAMPGGGFSLPESSRIKFRANALVVFGPAEGLEADEFLIPIVFSDQLLVVSGTWSANAKGKLRLAPDAQSFTQQLDELLLATVEDCRLRAKVKIREKRGERWAKTRIRSRCKLRNVQPPQRLKVRLKASGGETLL